MHKQLITIMLFLLSLNAQKLEINAKSFEGNKDAHSGVFSNNVKIKQGNDYLNCEKLSIKTSTNNKITSYEALSVSSFSITMANSVFKGRANRIYYDVNKALYELSGDVKISENNKELLADYIQINQKNGTYKVKSNQKNKPVKLIFEIEK